VTNTVDPLAGSYFVERLTSDIEAEAWEYIQKIDEMGGMVEAIDRGFPQREIQDAAYEFQKAVDRGDKLIVGINAFAQETEHVEVPVLFIDESVGELQRQRLADLRATRDATLVASTLDALQAGATEGRNTMPLLIDCVRAYATLGEMCDALRTVYGEYEEPIF
jgi:methylmalonyl-CoA mutase, N-terminal domain